MVNVRIPLGSHLGLGGENEKRLGNDARRKATLKSISSLFDALHST